MHWKKKVIICGFACIDGWIDVNVQLAGKRRMDANEFLKSYHKRSK
jgi:hypothetical protein